MPKILINISKEDFKSLDWWESFNEKDTVGRLLKAIHDGIVFPDDSMIGKCGYWKFVHPLQKNDGGAYMCSCCQTGDWSYKNDYKYCPNCGAKMR